MGGPKGKTQQGHVCAAPQGAQGALGLQERVVLWAAGVWTAPFWSPSKALAASFGSAVAQYCGGGRRCLGCQASPCLSWMVTCLSFLHKSKSVC